MVDRQPSASPYAEADAGARGAADYLDRRRSGGADAALSQLLQGLAGRPASAWLACGRALVLGGDVEAAVAVFAAAHVGHPDDGEVALALAGLLWQRRQADTAEALLVQVLSRHPGDAAAAFLLARMRREQGRMRGVEDVLRALFRAARQDMALTIQAIEWLDACGRKQAAVDICEDALANGMDDPRLHAYAGMLHLQLGGFDRAREHYLFALDHAPQAVEWEAANALASLQRYDDAGHADFARFEQLLARADLRPAARASVLFALGKANDDVGRLDAAARCFRDGNAIVAASVAWSRKHWRRAIEARLAAQPLPRRSPPPGEAVPVFIVGAPRSGTTLAADRLARSTEVCNRGELPWIAHLAQQVARSPRPDIALLDSVAATYLAQLRQDDGDATWFIDKQPLNVLHLDLIAALFPQAKIIHCVRNSRDTALSIWMQHFAGPENAFAYEFAHIAAVLHDVPRLVAQARRTGTAIHTLRYEHLIADPIATLAALARDLGLAAFDATATPPAATVISTSSAWQARQPVYARAVGRWRAYEALLPELRQFPDD